MNKNNLSVKCRLCGREFQDGRGLNSHLLHKHPELPQLKAKGRNPRNKKNALYKF
jgi:hypothetical protein